MSKLTEKAYKNMKENLTNASDNISSFIDILDFLHEKDLIDSYIIWLGERPIESIKSVLDGSKIRLDGSKIRRKK